MEFVRRTATTGKAETLTGARKETNLTFLPELINKFEEFQIPL